MSHLTRNPSTSVGRLSSALWLSHFPAVRSLLLRFAVMSGYTLSGTLFIYRRFSVNRYFILTAPWLNFAFKISLCSQSLHGTFNLLHRYTRTYVRTYIHTYVHTYIRTYIHTYVHTYVHTYIRTYIHTYIHTYVHTYVRTYVHTYVRTYVHTYIRTYIHTYIHTNVNF
jgi:hypothetical protein